MTTLTRLWDRFVARRRAVRFLSLTIPGDR